MARQKITYDYVPVKGARISRNEATMVGEVITRLREQDRWSPAEFLEICKNPKEKVHRVWQRVRENERKAVDQRAADYLTRAVDIIVLVDGRPVAYPKKAVYTIPLGMEPAVSAALPEMCNSPDLIAKWLENFGRDLERMIVDVQDFASEAEVRAVVEGVFTRLYPKRLRARG